MLNDRLVRWLSRQVARSGRNVDMEMPVSVATDIGSHRLENQDRVAVMRVNTMSAHSRTFVVVAVADGMGGMNDGAACATRAIAAFFNSLIQLRQKHPSERLKLAAEFANTAVHEFSNGKGGATLSALVLTADNGMWTVNVGDSRIYGIFQSKKVTRLTVDDSLEEAVGGHGKDLLQFIGMGTGISPHISQVPPDVNRMLITSDGVHFIPHEILVDILIATEKRTDVVDQLMTYARWRGFPDNASLAVVDTHDLISQLPTVEESGIEVWDAFSELHVMWIKQDQLDAAVRNDPTPNLTDEQAPFYSQNERAPFLSSHDQVITIEPTTIIEHVSSAQEVSIFVSDKNSDIGDTEIVKKTTKARSKTSATARKKRSSRSTKKSAEKIRAQQLSIDVETSND